MMNLEGRIIQYIKRNGPCTIQSLAKYIQSDPVEIRRTVWRMISSGTLARMPGNNYRYYMVME